MSDLFRLRRILVLFFLLIVFAGIESSYSMEVLVVLPNGQTVTVPYTSASTVSEVKEFVFNVTEIHTINQRMFKGSVELDNAKTLESYGIADRDTLVVRYGSSSPAPQKKSGGLIKIVLILVIIAGVILGLRKLFTRPIPQ